MSVDRSISPIFVPSSPTRRCRAHRLAVLIGARPRCEDGLCCIRIYRHDYAARLSPSRHPAVCRSRFSTTACALCSTTRNRSPATSFTTPTLVPYLSRACRPYRAKTKGKVERPFRYLPNGSIRLPNVRTHITTKRVVAEHLARPTQTAAASSRIVSDRAAARAMHHA